MELIIIIIIIIITNENAMWLHTTTPCEKGK